MSEIKNTKTQAYFDLRKDIIEVLKKGETYPLKIAKELYKTPKYAVRSTLDSFAISVRNTLNGMEDEKDPKIVDVRKEQGIERTTGSGKRWYKLINN